MRSMYTRQLEVYEFDKELVLCEIEIVPRKMYYFYGQKNGHRTHRWMQPENWAEFESELKHYLSKCAGTNQKLSNIKEHFETQFKLNSSIVVSVKKSSTSEYGKSVEKNLDDKHCDLVIECKFEFKKKPTTTKIKSSSERESSENRLSKSYEKHNETPEKSEKKNNEFTKHKSIDMSVHDNAKEPAQIERKLMKTIENEMNAAVCISKKNLEILSQLDLENNDEKKTEITEGHEKRKIKKKKIDTKGGDALKKKENSLIYDSHEEVQSSVSVKKRRLHRFENEKNTLGKWLNQKDKAVTIIDSDAETNEKHDKCEEFSIVKEVEKTENLMKTHQLEKKGTTSKRESKKPHESREVQNDKKKTPKYPVNYKYLTLDDFSSDELTSSLTQFKTVLDDIFKDNKTDSIVRSYNELDHYLVISLIDQKKQMDMMNKLSDVYQCDNGTFIANALLPEWLIRLFMQRYEVTRSDAIAQIKSQEANKIHASSSHSHKDSDPDLTLKQSISNT